MRENFVFIKTSPDLTLGIGVFSMSVFPVSKDCITLFHSVFNSFKNKKTTLDKLIEKKRNGKIYFVVTYHLRS